MPKIIPFTTTITALLADVFTPVSVYLRLRDRYRDCLLLEGGTFSEESGYSFIAVNAIGGIEMKNESGLEVKFPGQEPAFWPLKNVEALPALMQTYMITYKGEIPEREEGLFAQGLYGYTSYELALLGKPDLTLPADPIIPLMRYRMYQYLLAFHHLSDSLYFIENHFNGVESEAAELMTLIHHRDVPRFPFSTTGTEKAHCTDETFRNIVQKGIAHCQRGDVFQVVLSRRYSQPYQGDDFELYRRLRNLSPTPYLFYFSYGQYNLFGASPETQLLVKEGKASLHPIAGTVKRTGNAQADAEAAQELIDSPKENAEHTMLVDLARNDLSIFCKQVAVKAYKQLNKYSHVMHLVSEVTGTIKVDIPTYAMVLNTHPAGTLSGAPKVRAMQLIQTLEKQERGFYGGTAGFLGFDGSVNHAIMIRTIMSSNNQLHYQAGAGVVVHSTPEGELQEVHNKLGAIRKAIAEASRSYSRMPALQ